MNEWTDEQMNEWMNKRTNERPGMEQMNEWMNISFVQKMNFCHLKEVLISSTYYRYLFLPTNLHFLLNFVFQIREYKWEDWKQIFSAITICLLCLKAAVPYVVFSSSSLKQGWLKMSTCISLMYSVISKNIHETHFIYILSYFLSTWTE